MKKKLSAQAIVALKEALANIYWYKNDLEDFISNCGIPRDIIKRVDWQAGSKRDSVRTFVDLLASSTDHVYEYLFLLFENTSKINSFTHFNSIRNEDLDVEELKQKAISAVRALNAIYEPHVHVVNEKNLIKKREEEHKLRIKNNIALKEKLEILKKEFIALQVEGVSNTQKRGYDLEKLLYKLFDVYSMHPKASYIADADQIDGAFQVDDIHYLLEAKWHKNKIDKNEIIIFVDKVKKKLESTLGLFLSIEGFKESAISRYSNESPNIILMDGKDLFFVLDNRVSLYNLIKAKRAHASNTGEIWYSVDNLL